LPQAMQSSPVIQRPSVMEKIRSTAGNGSVSTFSLGQ
jgi:hypothetical protein